VGLITKCVCETASTQEKKNSESEMALTRGEDCLKTDRKRGGGVLGASYEQVTESLERWRGTLVGKVGQLKPRVCRVPLKEALFMVCWL